MIVGDDVRFTVDEKGEVSELWIELSRWARKSEGEHPNGGSSLLNSQGAMCCLGFYSRACGLAPEELFENCSPKYLLKDMRQTREMAWLDCTPPDGGTYCSELIGMNDEFRQSRGDTSPSAEKQKDEIAHLFMSGKGIKIHFV